MILGESPPGTADTTAFALQISKRGVALLFADRLFEWKNNQMSAQTSDQNRRPIFMVADLDRDNAAFGENARSLQSKSRARCSIIAECPENFAARVEEWQAHRLFARAFSPSTASNGSERFHRLRKLASRD